MKKANIRVLALLLVAVLVSGMLPASAWAADTAAPGIEVTEPPEAPAEQMPLDVTVPDETVPVEDVTLPAETAVPDATAEASDSTVPEAPAELPTEALPEEPTAVPTVPPTEAPTETMEPTQASTEPLAEAIKPTEGELQAELRIDGPVPEGLMPMSADNYIWFQGYVYRVDESAPNYKRTYTLKDGTHTIDLDHLYVMRLKVNGSWKVAYCLEPDTATHAGVDYGDGSNTGVSGDWRVNLTGNQQRAIGLTMLYSAQHHPDTLSSTESVEWEVATQIIIWEIVMGMRNSTQPYACTDSGLINQFDNASKGVRYNDGSNYYLKGIRAKYNTLSSEMALHGVIPSFTGATRSIAPTHAMQRQANGSYTLTLTDTNGVLGSYQFSSQSPVTLSQSGNTLTATAGSGASWDTLTFSASRTMINPENPACLFRIFYLDDNNQALASPPDKASIPSDPVPAYFKIDGEAAPGSATMSKAAESGPVDGYCFKMWQANGNKTYYGKSDSKGNVYVTDSHYAASGTKSYTFSGLQDGEFTFREVISASDHSNSHPVSWRFVVTDHAGKVTVDRTLKESEISADGGDFVTPRITLTGLTGGGKLTMTVTNTLDLADLQLIKTSDDGNVSGIAFTLEEHVPGIGYSPLGTYTTNAQRKLTIPGLKVGTTYRVTETVPDNYTAEKASQTITIRKGSNTLTFVNTRNRRDLELIKTSDDGNVSGIAFTVEEDVPGIGYTLLGTYKTNAQGKLTVPRLKVGTTYRVTEVVPKSYTAEQESQTITIQAENNVLTFVNTRNRRDLELVKQSDDGKVSDITFTVEEQTSETTWKRVGQFTTNEDGKILVPGLKEGATYRVTETVPRGYRAHKDVQLITIQEGTNALTFINYYNLKGLEIIKTSPDGHVAGIEFTITDVYGNLVNFGVTDNQGRLFFPDLTIGKTYLVTETVPEGYVTENPTQMVIMHGGVNTITFENRPMTGVIQLAKIDEGNPTVKLSGAVFTVTGEDGTEAVMPEVLDEDGNGTGVYRLEGLSFGTYTVRETQAPEGYDLSDRVYTVEITEWKTYEVKADGFDGVPNRQQLGSITARKVDLEGKPLSGVTFLLEYSTDGAQTWQPVYSQSSAGDAEPGSCTSPGLQDGRLTTIQEGAVVFSGLVTGPNVRYRLTETATQAGYVLLTEPAFEGELPHEGSRDIAITAVNTGAFTMPFTGSTGFTAVPLGLALVLFALCTAAFLGRKRKTEGEL
ncbi:MAG: SpaA isopeptide-forming pilin-related protein [Oscillospiraceae bacterium]